uniref:Uncharacterized protein n=1 Tax=Chenopodium quinoa TaxID=63459 RepID=A0A803LWX5_CHEQI
MMSTFLLREALVVGIDLPAEFIDGDDELAARIYFSLPDLWLPEFDYELTEPLCPPMSDHDFIRFYSLDLRVSGFVTCVDSETFTTEISI